MSTLTINIQDAQNQLQYLLSLALGGAEVIFTQDDKPVVRLTPVIEKEPPAPLKKRVFGLHHQSRSAHALRLERAPSKKRVFGLHRGQIWVSDDFDDELPDEFWLGEE